MLGLLIDLAGLEIAPNQALIPVSVLCAAAGGREVTGMDEEMEMRRGQGSSGNTT